ncbi:AAA family ATPase [Aliarcobacter cryaerophilus]|uniref:AAA family ATPase n=1 Tax=Aliarcobacter cryaerophilus TaxID=28198 RepID=UPI0021B336FB|nr:AAA family ATPase [Aliarcobacter cryaerophilus]MCT7495921.1 AAA family ATPase [Aliarcobacter cryaerophilus]MCT7527248.1 AAA family ATPase [Aliarcobacter cryaerophilus]
MLKSRIKKIVNCLKEGIFERDEIIAVSLLSALADQNIFLYGPPGTAKSLISRRLSKVFKTENYFEYLMQKFSTPEEVFGPISISQLKQDNYIRKTNGYLPTCDFAFLDEIWKSSPAILNTLLTIINEKVYKNGNNIEKVPLKVLISASNETPPPNQGLEALYDRFLTRLYVPPTNKRDNFELLLSNGGTSSEINIPENLIIKNEEWQKWKIEINKVKLSDETLNIIHLIRLELSKKNKDKSLDVYISDRRWQRAATLLKAAAFFCDRKETNIIDTLLLSHCLWTTIENRDSIIKLVEKCVAESGFHTDINIKDIDNEKEALEKEIIKETLYSTDIYETFKIGDNIECFKFKQYSSSSNMFLPTNNIDEFYIPYNRMKTNDEFFPIDKNGNQLRYIKCIFKNQGSCSIKYNENGKNDIEYLHYAKYWKELPKPFVPKILFYKGTQKEDVNSRLIDSLNSAVLNLTTKIEKILLDLEKSKEIFLKELETPFLLTDKIEIALKSINNQIEEIRIRYKDCSRLLSMVPFDNTKPYKESNNIQVIKP